MIHKIEGRAKMKRYIPIGPQPENQNCTENSLLTQEKHLMPHGPCAIQIVWQVTGY